MQKIKKTSQTKKEVKIALKYANSIITTLREPFLVINRNLRVVSVNQSFYTTFKITEKETIGQLLPNLGNGQWNIPKLIHLLEEILPQKTVVTNYEVEHEFKTIGRRIMNLNACQLRIPKKIAALITEEEEEEEEDLILLAIEDITERRKLEQKLAEYAESLEKKVSERTHVLAQEKAEVEAIFTAVGDHVMGLAIMDKNGKIIRVNKTFEALTYWKEKEVVGKFLTEVIPREDESGKRALSKARILSKILSGKILSSFSTLTTTTTTTTTTTGDGVVIEKLPVFYYVRKDKSRFPASCVINPIMFKGKIIGAVEVFHDVFHERELDKAKTDFVSIASHQLRTPLTGIQWLTELLEKEKLTDKGREYLNDIRTSIQRLNKLVELLLNVSRIEEGKIEISPQSIDVVNFTKKMFDNLVALFSKKRLSLTFTADEPKIIALTDVGALQNIAQAIFSNAVEYTPEGGKIGVSIKKNDQTFLLTVSDTGIGIPKKDQGRMFQEFARASNAGRLKAAGMGLGLWIAKQATELLGGKIWFESKENKPARNATHSVAGGGTTFFVELPIKSRSIDGTKKLV